MSRTRFYGGLIAIYVGIVAIATVVPQTGRAETAVSLIPFRQMWLLLGAARDRADVLVPIVGNIALFFPAEGCCR